MAIQPASPQHLPAQGSKPLPGRGGKPNLLRIFPGSIQAGVLFTLAEDWDDPVDVDDEPSVNSIFMQRRRPWRKPPILQLFSERQELPRSLWANSLSIYSPKRGRLLAVDGNHRRQRPWTFAEEPLFWQQETALKSPEMKNDDDCLSAIMTRSVKYAQCNRCLKKFTYPRNRHSPSKKQQKTRTRTSKNPHNTTGLRLKLAATTTAQTLRCLRRGYNLHLPILQSG